MDKGLKTFNLRRSTIKLVRTKHNQSEFVDRAINRLHNQEEEFSLIDLSAREIMRHLLSRGGCPKHIQGVIRVYLESYAD
jgi:hypothetical protein